MQRILNCNTQRSTLIFRTSRSRLSRAVCYTAQYAHSENTEDENTEDETVEETYVCLFVGGVLLAAVRSFDDRGESDHGEKYNLHFLKTIEFVGYGCPTLRCTVIDISIIG